MIYVRLGWQFLIGDSLSGAPIFSLNRCVSNRQAAFAVLAPLDLPSSAGVVRHDWYSVLSGLFSMLLGCDEAVSHYQASAKICDRGEIWAGPILPGLSENGGQLSAQSTPRYSIFLASMSL